MLCLSVRFAWHLHSVRNEVSWFLFVFVTPGNKPQPTLQIKPESGIMYLGESIKFTCLLGDSAEWDFIWEHNSTEIEKSGSTFTIDALDYSHNGNYQCIAKRGKHPFYTNKSQERNLEVTGKMIYLFYDMAFFFRFLFRKSHRHHFRGATSWLLFFFSFCRNS